MNTSVNAPWKNEAWYEYFKEICAIPHASYHTEEISNYLKHFATARGLKCTKDSLGNIVIRKNATPGREKEETVILQGHMDMVAVKTEEADIDMLKDGLWLKEENGFLFGEGTSLGGDDGIAVAYILAILDSDSISHPKLEALITVDEEVGMIGASALSASAIKGRRMINIDSESESEIIAGCAGGIRLDGEKKLDMFRRDGKAVKITVSGMTGGHSGTQIHLGRGNAARVMGMLISSLAEEASGQLISLESGKQDNVIPSMAEAVLLFKESRIEEAQAICERMGKEFQAKYTQDPGLTVSFTVLDEKSSEQAVFTKQDTLHVCELLTGLPNDVIAMSTKMEGIVETSTNIGIVYVGDHKAQITCALRSSVEKERDKLLKRMAEMMKELGFETSTRGAYPGWDYDPSSELCKKATALYPEFFGRKPVVTAVHAGLECGVIMDKVGKIDCISIGPDIHEIHSVNEKLDLASSQRVWKFLLALLDK